MGKFIFCDEASAIHAPAWFAIRRSDSICRPGCWAIWLNIYGEERQFFRYQGRAQAVVDDFGSLVRVD